jgi:2-dehydro-3-deoxyphosphogluconate aldolase/(4S)-4-hydroxy-2-oxoglutarate aldolase
MIFERKGILAILRGINIDRLEKSLEVAIEIGFDHIEIALNTPDALNQLEKANGYLRKNHSKIHLGAGTVNYVNEAEEAISRGAEFLVSPSFNPDVLALASQKNVRYVPGVLTPTEVMTAFNKGSHFLKLFPASVFGPQYLRQLREPFRDSRLKFMVTGGIRSENIRDYFRCGADFAAVGASLFNPSDIENEKWDKIKKNGIDLFNRINRT